MVPNNHHQVVHSIWNDIENNEERIKTRLPITAKASADAPQMGGPRLGMEMLEEIKEIMEVQEKNISYIKYYYNWNFSYRANRKAMKIIISNVLAIQNFMLEGSSRQNNKRKKKSKSMPRHQFGMTQPYPLMKKVQKKRKRLPTDWPLHYGQ